MKSVQICTIANVLESFYVRSWVDMLLFPGNIFLCQEWPCADKALF